MWPPMALRIALLRSAALQNDGHITPVRLQCRAPQEITFSYKPCFCFLHVPSLGIPTLTISKAMPIKGHFPYL